MIAEVSDQWHLSEMLARLGIVLATKPELSFSGVCREQRGRVIHGAREHAEFIF